MFNNFILKETIMKKVWLIIIVLIFTLTGCGDGDDKTENQDDSETADKTQVEDEDTEVQDEEKLKESPGDDFYDPTLNMTFEFEGMINSLEDAESGAMTNGIASMTLKFNDYEEDAFTTQPFVYLTAVKEGTSFPEEYLGKDIVTGGFFSDDIVQEDGFVKYKALYFGMIVDPILKAKESNIQILTLEGLDFINFMDVQYKKRADGVVVRRSCILATKKKESEQSKYFIDFSGSGNFEPGDNFHIFGNLELEYDEEALKEKGLEEDEGMLCSYRMDDTDLTKAEYQIEIEKSGLELSCDLPEKFETPPEDNYVDMLFKGDITSSDGVKADFGATELVLNGEKIIVDDYQSSAYIWNSTENGKLLIVESMGGIKALSGNEHLEFKISRLLIPIDTLTNVFNEGDETCHIVYSTDNYFFYNYDINEQKVVDGVINMKSCTTAIPAEESLFFDAFFCTKGNTDFSAGESIEMRAIVDISNDEEWLKELYEVDTIGEICQCYNADEIFDCADFETLGE
jgi:hypothetical protein